ncbi:related to U2 small nuclear ribonucleoprotein B [Ustilago bromivora]|uniref:Related to U2 small nuclear ribonucleoprotein B n=1 Tax=Ustilago bromivora TaxID=307758 RepID=A0A8H8QKQ3_9BASI|nr:related to U2 small nuclear ribonucleoprotein B [Ustilago bromivora]
MPSAPLVLDVAAEASSSKVAPSPTLYVKNIEGKVKKPELRRQLHSLFSTYGRVLDVVATRANGMRGQAFIVFENPSFSTAAKRGLHNFSFYSKPLHIEYSTGSKSKALLRKELGYEAVQEMDLEKSRTTESKRGEKRANQTAPEEEEEEEEGSGRKRVKREEDEEEEDGVIVRASNVPGSIEGEVISALFSRQSGYVETDEGTNREDGETWTAEIRFDGEESAKAALESLQGVQIDPMYKLELSIVS